MGKPSLYVVVRASYKEYEADLARVRGITREQGEAISNALNNSISPKQAIKGFESLSVSLQKAIGAANAFNVKPQIKGLDELAKIAGVSAERMDYFTQAMIKTARENSLERSLQSLQKQTGMSQLAMAKLRFELGDTAGAFKTIGSVAAAAAIPIAAFSVAAGLLGKSALDAQLSLQRMSVAYQTIFGADTNQQLGFLYTQTQKIGLEFTSTAEAAKGFFAAGKNSTLAPQVNEIFTAVANASGALQLSEEQVGRTFLALGQMISKGKVQAEELRGQLGEQLPGAFQLAAKAMGMTTAELDKFMADGKLTAEVLLPRLARELNDNYAAAAANAANSMQGALNRLSTDWNLFKASAIDTGAAVGAINMLHEAVLGLQGGLDWIISHQTEIKGAFAALAGASSVYGLRAMADSASLLRVALASISGSVLRLAPLLVSPWGAAAAAAAAAGYAVYKYADSVDVAAQAQREIDAAQRASTQSARDFADQSSLTAKKLDQGVADAEGRINNLGYSLDAIRQSMANGLPTGNWLEDLFGMTANTSSLDYYGRKLVELRKTASETKDFDALKKGLDDLSKEAESGGRMTETLRKQIDATQKLASLGIQLNISITGQEELKNVQERLKYWQGIYTESSTPMVETDWRERRDANTSSMLKKFDNDFQKTATAKLQQDRDDIKEYKDQIKAISSLYADDSQKSEATAKLNALIKDRQAKIDNANKAGERSAIAAAKAENGYAAAVAETTAQIAGYQQQLSFDKSESLGRAKAKIESEYQQAVAKTTKEIENQVVAKKITASEGDTLMQLKMQSLELKKQVEIREAEERAREKEIQMVGDQLNFYKELGELSGQYGNQLDMQVKLIELQASKYEDVLKIPKELVEQWKKYKLLQESYDPWDGAYRGLVKFTAEYSNEAKQWESITYSWATGFNDTTKDMWGDFLDTGRVSFDKVSLSFTKFLKDMSYQALVQPIVLPIVGMAQNSIYGMTTAGQSGGGSSGSSNVYGMASGMAQQYATNKLMSGATSAFGDTINGWAASAFPNTFAPNAAAAAYNAPLTGGEALLYEGVAGQAPAALGPTNTLTGSMGTMFNPYTIGGGAVGSIGASYLSPAIWGNSQSVSTGTAIGSAAGMGIGGALILANSWNPVGWAGAAAMGIGALLGGVGGGGIGSMFGGGGSEPGLWLDSTTILSGDVSRDTMEGWSQPNKGRSGFADAGGMGYYTQARARNGMDASAATSSAQYLAQLSQQAIALSASVKSQLESIDTTLGGSYAGEIAKNPRVYVSGNGEGGDTPSAEALGQQLLNQTYARITEAVGRMDLSKLAVAADGMVSNTMDEVEDSITKAMRVVGISNSMGDYATKYTDAVGGKILDALNSMDLSSLSGRLTVDKTSLTGWSSAYVAIQAFDNVQTSIDSILEPTNEMFTALNAANKQMNSWIDTLEQLGWQEAAIQDVEEKRYAYLQRYSDSLARGAEQDLYLRGMSLTSGSDSWAYQSQALRYQQENELRSAETKYGQYSTIYTSLLATQQAESTQAEISFLRKQYDSLLQEQINSAQSLVNSFDRVVDSLDEARRNLWSSDANISTSRLADARADFSTVYAKAMAGDADAMAELPSISTNLLNLGKEQIASRSTYEDLFYDVDAKLKSAQGIAYDQYTAANSQVNLLKSQLSAQDQTNMTLSDINLRIATLGDVLSGQLSVIAGLTTTKTEAYKQNATQGGAAYSPGGVPSAEGIYGSKYKTEADLVAAKVSSLNITAYKGKTNWTAADFAAEVKTYDNATIEKWYRQQGVLEGFAEGGITPANQPFWVGENGPELVVSPQQWGVINNTDSMALMRGMSGGGNINSGAIVAAINNMNDTLRQLLTKTDRIMADQGRIRDRVDMFAQEGVTIAAA